ncbi:hypothetical protein Tco_1391773 [Tanacetum coccineum]
MGCTGLVAPRGANQIARSVIDDQIEFSGETSVDGYMSFFKSQQIAESRGFINWMREEANITRNLVGQLNALIVELEVLKIRERNWLWCLSSNMRWSEVNIRESNSRLRVEKSRPKAFETMAELSSLYIGVLLEYGSILNILQGRNELLEKIIGCVVDSGVVPDLDPKVWDCIV